MMLGSSMSSESSDVPSSLQSSRSTDGQYWQGRFPVEAKVFWVRQSASRLRPKTRYPLFKALLHRGEQRLGETGRHVSKRRGKCLLRSRVDVHEDTRDLFTGKPGSQTRLDEVATLDFGDLVVTAFPGTHRKFMSLI
jgi:hypothetical protein